MNIDNVRADMKEKERQKIIAQHKYTIFYDEKDKRFKTYLPDDSKKYGRRLIAKRDKHILEELVIDYYVQEENAKKKQPDTLESFYPLWLQHKNLRTTQGDYIKRIDSDWKKYYSSSPMIKIPLVDLTKGYLSDWCYSQIKTLHLTKTQFYNMSIIVRQGLQYAFDLKMIPDNPFENIRIDSKMFAKKKQKPDEEEVFLYSEQPALEKAAFDEFYRSNCTFSLAIPLAFQLGVRVGECTTLRFSDIVNETYIHVQRMEVDDYTLSSDCKLLSNGRKIVEHTKTAQGDREVYLTLKAREIIQLIHDFYKANNLPTDEYIFMNQKGNAHRYNIDYRLRKCCHMANISERSTHKIRKSYISALIDSGEINIKQIMTLAGHTSAKTTYGNYCFNRKGKAETQKSIEKALTI